MPQTLRKGRMFIYCILSTVTKQVLKRDFTKLEQSLSILFALGESRGFHSTKAADYGQEIE